MSILTVPERTLVTRALLGIGGANRRLLILDVLGESDDSIDNRPAAVVTAHISERMLHSTEVVQAICRWLVQTVPGSPGVAAIRPILDRLAAQAALAGSPVDALWIGAEPMVNRTALRSLLADIVDGFDHGVVYVAGAPMSGRSHSRHLIRHVARSAGVAYFPVELAFETEARTLTRLFTQLKQAWGLDGLDDPTHEGATPGDIARRFAAWLRHRLAAADSGNPKPWIVIDFSEEVPDPAVPEFIRLLCIERERSAFDNCVLFVLGPFDHLETLRDLPAMMIEELGPISETEILATARIANERGKVRIDPVVLEKRVAGIYRDLAALPENARYPAVRRALVELRKEVRAP